uniref:Protein ALP1-like n=1 Tax=Elaeis guineensis var. tenera TaxID=51953 RepID=A0A6I9RJP0_ELAGV|nr:protein ALP1-like [Elaeis guineensis]XP_029121691.1 protein ALP1-like [Elaeis guineensis]
MEPRLVAALVSSLVTQALLLLLLLSFSFSSSSSSSIPSSSSSLLPNLLSPSSSSPPPPLLALLFPHLAAFFPFLPRNRKRKRERDQEQAEIEADDKRGGEEEEEEAAPCSSSSRSSSIVASPDHFRLSFRMSAATFEWLSGLLDPLLDCRDPAGSPLRLPGPARLALALARIASGAPYRDLAARFAVPETAARFCARHLCRVLCTNFRFWLAFPAPPDLRPVAAAFRSLGLPDCCGALACARFDGSVAAQIVADASSRILSIAAGFRGDRSDSSILRCSSLYKNAERGRLLGPDQYLVGDGEYPLLPWLMVPFADPVRGSCEEDFNAVHRSMSRPALRAVASLRNWGVLGRLGEEEDAKAAAACIGTCAILHNVLLMREDYSALADATRQCPATPEHAGGGEDAGLEDFTAERNAFVVRSTLAVRARAIRDASRHLVCP